EQRLAAPIAECQKPLDPGEYPDMSGNEQMEQKNTIMSDLVPLSLACGRTRAFSIMFSTCGSGAVFWMVGATDGQHYMNHTEPSPQPLQREAMKFTMQQLAYFLERLRSTPEGAGNLLDHSS